MQTVLDISAMSNNYQTWLLLKMFQSGNSTAMLNLYSTTAGTEILMHDLWKCIIWTENNIIMKLMTFCGKQNTDHEASPKNAVNFLVT
jgi:hypothetical protein